MACARAYVDVPLLTSEPATASFGMPDDASPSCRPADMFTAYEAAVLLSVLLSATERDAPDAAELG